MAPERSSAGRTMPEGVPSHRPGGASPPAFWQRTRAALLAELHTDGRGLASAEAATRLARAGPNTLRHKPRRAIAVQFLLRLANPLVLLLFAAAGIAALTGDVASFSLICTVVVLSVTLDFVQEHRAGRAAERLERSVALRAMVLRDGAVSELPVAEIVPGDVVELGPGRLVPADGRVLESRDLFVSQAILTGEAYPVEKLAGERPTPPASLDEAVDSLFMGTSVIGGRARLLVCRTGAGTLLGEIGESLGRPTPASAFESGVRSFGMLVLRLAITMVLFVLLVNAWFHRPWLESFLFAVALAVGLTPELLPMVLSVTLARGALRMAKQRVIVKRLPAVHDLGCMDVLCTDKTGTLTEGRIRLEQHLDPQGRDSARTLELAYLNSSMESGLVTPMDEAILKHGEVDVRRWTKVDEVPFDFERRCVSVLADDGERRLLVHKGAFEDVLRHCATFEAAGPERLEPLDAAARLRLTQAFEALGGEGFRVLGIAWKETPRDHPHAVVDDESELAFAGFAAFEDPPKASATEAVRALSASGVAIKVVTGDHERVTMHLCERIGLEVTGVLTGQELQAMTDPALLARVEGANAFCRVTPAQKGRILRLLRARGHVVGYLGDGINDAPPLHLASVGLSVEGAADVAREAADLILLDTDLGVVHRGVLEGRRTFGNIMKYLMMGTSSNFGNMFSMAGGTLVLPFLPLTSVQILVNNFLYDLSELPIPLDEVDAETLAKPRRWSVGDIRDFMLVVGPVSSLFDFLTFFVLLLGFHAGQALFRTGWFIESLATQVLVIFVIRTRGNPLRSRPAPLLTITSLAVVAAATALPWTPLGAWLGFVPVPARFFGVLAALVVAYLAAVEGTKRWFYARQAKRGR